LNHVQNKTIPLHAHTRVQVAMLLWNETTVLLTQKKYFRQI